MDYLCNLIQVFIFGVPRHGSCIRWKVRLRFRLAAQSTVFNPLNAKLNPICHLLAMLGAHPILQVSSIRVNTRVSDCMQDATAMDLCCSGTPAGHGMRATRPTELCAVEICVWEQTY